MRIVLTRVALMFLVTASVLSASEIWDPPAITDHPYHGTNTSSKVAEFMTSGERLFATKFNLLDGAGRPKSTGDSKPTPRSSRNAVNLHRVSGPDALSCHACHNQPGMGGSGDFVTNVFVGAHFVDDPSTSISSDLTNERNTTSVAGAGLVELVAREITTDLHAIRDAAIVESRRSARPIVSMLESKGIRYGSITAYPDSSIDFSAMEGIDYDLVVKPFGVKGIASSLREFTIAALNQHHGIQSVERFGWERTGSDDHDGDGVADEFSIGQVSALVLFQAGLPPPFSFRNLTMDEFRSQDRGLAIFETIKCDSCHVITLPTNGRRHWEPNPYNRPGTLVPRDGLKKVQFNLTPYLSAQGEVQMFSDLKRHNLCDLEVRHFCNEKLKQDNVGSELFLTSKLWDLATSGPYGHRGDLGTISQAIFAHGGEARTSRERFLRLSDKDKRKLIKFLLSLGSDAMVEQTTQSVTNTDTERNLGGQSSSPPGSF